MCRVAMIARFVSATLRPAALTVATFWWLTAPGLLTGVALAETLLAPRLTPGDTWTYAAVDEVRGQARTTHRVATLMRADRRLIAVEEHPVGAPDVVTERLYGPDWSRSRGADGRETMVSRPLAFPLSFGKTWTVDYVETAPADPAHAREKWHMVHKVVGWEDITVPAGTFRALRIEGDGTWTADPASAAPSVQSRASNGSARQVSGRFLKAVWYVPEVHRWVRAQEEIFDSEGRRTSRTTEDLESFGLADPAGAAAEAAASETPLPGHATRAQARKPTAPARPTPDVPARPSPPRPALPPLRETRASSASTTTAPLLVL